MASSHLAWSYWSDATVLDDYAMTTTTMGRKRQGGRRGRERKGKEGYPPPNENPVYGSELSCSREVARYFVSLESLLSHSRSFKVIENGTIRKLRYGFLSAFGIPWNL